jgi:hypothetical protein
MTRAFRRLVTGHDADGRSLLVADRRIEESGAAGNFNFWLAPSRPDAGTSGAGQSFPFFPEPGSTIFRVFRIPPGDPGTTPGQLAEIAAGFFAELGDPSCRVASSRNPMMHRTPTVDYIMLLSGEASLLLDRGDAIALKPLDAVVQRATSHAWINTGREDAVFLAVMVGARP